MTQWAYTPHLLTKWAPPSPSTVHRISILSSLLAQWAHTFSFYDTVGLHPHLLTQWAPPSPSTVHTLSSLISSLTCTVGPYLLILGHSESIPPHLLTQ